MMMTESEQTGKKVEGEGGEGGVFRWSGRGGASRGIYIISHSLARSQPIHHHPSGRPGATGQAPEAAAAAETRARERERETTQPKEGAQDARYRKKKASSKGDGHLFRFLTRLTLASGSKRVGSLEQART